MLVLEQTLSYQITLTLGFLLSLYNRPNIFNHDLVAHTTCNNFQSSTNQKFYNLNEWLFFYNSGLMQYYWDKTNKIVHQTCEMNALTISSIAFLSHKTPLYYNHKAHFCKIDSHTHKWIFHISWYLMSLPLVYFNFHQVWHIELKGLSSNYNVSLR